MGTQNSTQSGVAFDAPIFGGAAHSRVATPRTTATRTTTRTATRTATRRAPRERGGRASREDHGFAAASRLHAVTSRDAAAAAPDATFRRADSRRDRTAGDRTAGDRRAEWNVRAAVHEMPARMAKRAAGRPADARAWAEAAVAGVNGAAGAVVSFVREHRKTSVAVLVAVFVAFMLYGPARDCYVSARMNEDLQTKYDEIVTENERFSNDISRLQSREGIEDLARARGFVGEGETSVSVEGLPEEAKRDASAAIEYVDERGWQQKALDAFFGYDPVEAFK